VTISVVFVEVHLYLIRLSLRMILEKFYECIDIHQLNADYKQAYYLN
jgi:hypothetical protein